MVIRRSSWLSMTVRVRMTRAPFSGSRQVPASTVSVTADHTEVVMNVYAPSADQTILVKLELRQR